MKLLEERIRTHGKIREGGVLKVDSFLNHQMDVELFAEIGKEFKRRFADREVNKILTIEASGIGIACIVAQSFGVPWCSPRRARARISPGGVFQPGAVLHPRENLRHHRVKEISGAGGQGAGAHHPELRPLGPGSEYGHPPAAAGAGVQGPHPVPSAAHDLDLSADHPNLYWPFGQHILSGPSSWPIIQTCMPSI